MKFARLIFCGSAIRRPDFTSLQLNAVAIALSLLIPGLCQAAPLTFQWADTGKLAGSRSQHTGTVLVDARVLVAGGIGVVGSFDTTLSTAELYDPGAGRWNTTGNLSVARSNHTATRLGDGRVLVAGGLGADFVTQLDSVEIYEPDSGQFTVAESMHSPRVAQFAVTLADGRVLVAGGFNQGIFLKSAEIYDPASGVWTLTANMNAPHNGAAVLLRNGQVLVMGGTGSGGSQSAELYDPVTAAWTFTGSMLDLRAQGYTATVLRDGTVLVVGGENLSAETLKSCELYDPATGTWSKTGEMKIARGLHEAVLLPKGRVLAVGGSFLGSHGYVYPTLTETYNPNTGRWTDSGNLLVGRSLDSTNVLRDGRVLVAGGFSDQGTGIIRRCELGTRVTAPVDP